MEATDKSLFNFKKAHGAQGPTVTPNSLETPIEVSDSISPSGSKYTPEENNHTPVSIEVT